MMGAARGTDSTSPQESSSRAPSLLASLDLIAKASAELLQPSSEVERLLPAVLEMAKALISADAYAVWEKTEEGGWRIIASSGLSEQYQSQFIPPSRSAPPPELYLIPDVMNFDVVADRRELYQRESIASMMVVPLMIGSDRAGTLTFYYHERHDFTSEESSLATALGNLTGAALSTGRVYRDKELDRKRSEFLSRASAVLASSLDHETTLTLVTKLAVPGVADWCAVDLVDGDRLQRLAVAHVDPEKLALSAEYRKKYPPDINASSGVGQVVRTGQTVFAPVVTDEVLAHVARDPEHLQLLRGLGIRSVVIVPLSARERTVGALTLVSTERIMTAADVELAEELARRSAVAIENAELFRALEDSERKFRVVTDTVPCAIYIHDGERLLYVNEAAVQLGGYSREELASMSMFDLVHPDDRAMMQQRAAARLSGDGTPSRYEFRGIKKDGSVVWLDFAGSLVNYGGRRALLATAFDITERKIAEDKIQRSELEARTLLNNIPDVVARYGPDLRYRYISPSVERLTGIPVADFIGKTHRELGFPPELCELFDNSVQKILRTGKPDSIEFSLERGGEMVYALGLGIPQFGPDGTVESVLTISRDVSDMRRASEAIRRSEEELRLLTDSLPALVAYVDKDQRLMRVNKTFEQWFGRPQNSFYGRTLLEVMGERNYQHVRVNVERALAGELVQYETTNEYADRERHVLIAYVPDFDEQRHVRGFAALIQDLTERQQAQRALEASEQRLRKFAEAGPAILYSNLPNGYCDFVSQRFLDYTGLTEEQALGYGWLDVVHPDDAGRVRSQWERSALEALRNEDEYRVRRYDGTYRWFHTWNVPVRDESDEVVRWFGTTMDVEDQKQAEEALRKSEKLAAVGRLAASISHEINNPLEAVTNLIFLAKNDPGVPPRSREFLTTAEQELARVSQIATQTLRFYRQSSRPTRTNLGELIDAVIALYEGRLSNAQIVVRRRYSRDQEPVYAFEGELRQVLANLIGNAIDATGPNGRIVVKACHCRRWSTGEKGTRITIADTGHGIGPESKKRIFEPFFTTKKSTGTGLGLWVTREIVVKHHGYIRVRSSVKRGHSGTVFMLFLPELVAEASASTGTGV